MWRPAAGSLATLYPVKYILERETDAVTVSAVNAAEFYNDPPRRLGEHALVILNSQSGTTAETVAAARLARERGALTAAFTTAPAPSWSRPWTAPSTTMTTR